MTAEEKATLTANILAKIAQTEAAILDYREQTQPIAPDVAIGRISRMDAINNKSVMESALREAENKLGRLTGVLSRLDEASFGLCSRCKSVIPFQRLLFMPDSSRCVNCANR